MMLPSEPPRGLLTSRKLRCWLGALAAAIGAGAIPTTAQAQIDLTAYSNFVSGQAPDEWLRFNGDFANTGAVGSTFASNGGGFGADVESTAGSAFQITGDTNGVSTSTDVVSNPTGALSFLFQAPNFADPSVGFTRDRYLFDGGFNNGNDFGLGGDDAFQALWNDGNSSIDVVVGNSTLSIPSSDIEATPGAWYYLGVTWDEDQNSSAVGEVQAVFGQVGGTAAILPRNIANTDASIGDGLSFYIGNRGVDAGTGLPDGARDAFGSDAWVASSGEAGSIDEFAIWNRRLEPTELVAQFNALNSIPAGPAAPADAIVFDGFDDGNRSNQTNGINWYSIDGNDRVSLTVDNSAANAIGDGAALALDASGNPGGQFQGVFDQQIQLGSETGSTLRLSFNARFERTVEQQRLDEMGNPIPVLDDMDMPVFNDDGEQVFEMETVSAPVGEADASLRFGLYADSDEQFGQTDGDGNVWGSSDGNFESRNDGVGVTADNGVYATISFAGEVNNGGNSIARVRSFDTLNQANSFGGGSGGQDGMTQDLLFNADAMDPTDPAADAVIDSELVHTISLELTRVGEGDQIRVTLTIDDGGDVGEDGDAQVFVFSGIDSDDPSNMNHDPDDNVAADLETLTIFDYFTADLSARGEDITWVFDNFAIEDLIIDLGPNGDANDDGFVNAADYTAIRDGATSATREGFLAQFGDAPQSAAVSASVIPEPSGLVGLLIGLAGFAARSRR